MNKILFSLSLGVISSILALPSGHSVKHGKVKVNNRGDRVVVTSGKNAVIHWDQFSIGKNETAKFKMQDSKSSVLNRVTGGNKSEILGRMESNGKVYLLNSKGVLFGKDCEINVGGLVASTLDALDADYIKGGKILFEGDSNASIVNLGKISSAGGDVHLLAQKVKNSGSIDAYRVGLGSGSQILIKPQGNERIFVKAGNGSIDHSGSVKAVVTELKTKSAYEMAINCSGSIEGVRANRVKGRIYLNADGGKTVVDNKLRAEGGKIRVLGEEITLAENADLDVSSAKCPGGRIDIGENKEVHSIFVNEGARLDATGKPGGKIYLLAGELEFNGQLRAHGIGKSDGGFAEISSVSENYRVGHDCSCYDLSSDSGRAGEILFDPGTITIDVSGTGGPCTFGDAFITGLLAGGMSVTIDSTGQTAPSVIACGSGATPFDIVFTGGPSIIWATDTTFTLTADRAIGTAAGTPFTVSNTFAGASATPAIVFTATGTPSAAPTENFIGVDLSAGTLSSDTKAITVTGTGGNSGASNFGVLVGGAGGSVSSTSGTITITGTSVGDATAVGTTSNTGVQITDSVVAGAVSTASGDITITGIAGAGDAGNFGVRAEAVPISVTTVDGLITIDGTGGSGVTGGGNGVSISGTLMGTVISSTGGTHTPTKGITIIGVGGSGGTGNHGISFDSTGLVIPAVSTVVNPISLTGSGGSGTSFNVGINLPGDETISSTTAAATGTITLMGTAGSGAGSCVGTFIHGGATLDTITSDGSDIVITGVPHPTTPGTLMNNDGVAISINNVRAGVSGGDGSISITGTGSSAGSSENSGVLIGSTEITTATGSITITGSGGAASSTDNNGVFIGKEGEVTSTTGAIDIDGTAFGGTDDNNGILVIELDALVSSGGDVFLTGVGAGSGERNHGISIVSSAVVSATSTGKLELMGTGATNGSGVSCAGINVESSSVTSETGDVTITGIGGDSGSACTGVNFSSATFASTGGSVVFTGTADGDDAPGIGISGGSFTLVAGSLMMTGTGDGVGTLGTGINITGPISSTGGATLTFMGTGAPLADSRIAGIAIQSAATKVTSNGGNITMTGIGGGGAGITSIMNPGIGVIGSGSGIEGTDVNGVTAISLTGTGGTGVSLCPGVFVENPAEVRTATGTITIDGTGGSPDSTTSYGVLVDGSAAGTDEVTSTSGTISITGREGGTDNRGILVTDLGEVSTDGPINITTLSDLDLDTGGRIIGGAGLLTLDIDRDVNITGDMSIAGILPGSGGLTADIGRDLNVVATSSGTAVIGNQDIAGVTSDMTFTRIGRNVLVDGGDIGFLPSGIAIIGHGLDFGATFTGNITFTDVVGNVTVRGADAGAGGTTGVGVIGHLDPAGSILNGNINITARGSISVIGGTAGASADAQIGHGLFGGSTTTSSSMTLIAGNNIAMTSQAGAGSAIITNPSTSAANSLRLVVDNDNPVFPAFGAATFSINSGSVLTMPNSAGEVRIYTVQPSQNTVGTTINGAVFTPTAFNVDDANNLYNTYFPDGSFIGGAAFRVYYKTGGMAMAAMTEPFVANRFYCLGEAMGELQDRLPLFRFMRMPENSGATWHHPSFCDGKSTCDPAFDPYHSLNFKSNVYWVGSTSSDVL